MRVLNTRYGQMTVPGDADLISQSLELYGEWAEAEISVLKDFISHGSLVLDVGACFGTHALAFADWVGIQGKVIAIDASPENFEYLKLNANSRRYSGAIELINVAASSEPTRRFNVTSDETNFGSVKAEQTPTGAVRAVTIDDLGLERLDFIKLDIEGMEAEALKGARNTLERFRPAVFFELNSVHCGLAVIDVLRPHDYNFFGIAIAAFNPGNFKNNQFNLFGSGRECGVLALPAESKEAFASHIGKHGFVPVHQADDLASVLFQKPQYLAEFKLDYVPKSQTEAQLQLLQDASETQLQQLRVASEAALRDLATLTVNCNAQREQLLQAEDNRAHLQNELLQTSLIVTEQSRQIDTMATRQAKLSSKIEELEKARAVQDSEILRLTNDNNTRAIEIERLLALSEVQSNELDRLRREIETREGVRSEMLTERSILMTELRRMNDLLSLAKLIEYYSPRFPLSTWFGGRASYQDARRKIAEAAQSPKFSSEEIASASSKDSREAIDAAENERIKHELPIVRRAFDQGFYLRGNPEDISLGIEPAEHYCRHGWREGRDPCPDFSTNFYLRENPDVAAAGVNPFWHYLVAGKDEGRLPNEPPQANSKIHSWLDSAVKGYRKTRTRSAETIDTVRLVDLLATKCDEGSMRLLISVGHDDYRNVPGGVQVCIQREERAASAAGIAYLNIHPAEPLETLSDRANSPDPQMNLVLSGVDIGIISMSSIVAATKSLADKQTSIDIVVHHLLGHSPEQICALTLATGHNRLWFWLHDFFSLCPSYTLQRNNVSYCGAPSSSSNACALCVHGEERSFHLERFQELFSALEVIAISPSQVMADNWSARGNLKPKKLITHPHMTLGWEASNFEDTIAPDDLKNIGIGFAGTCAPHKGWQIFKDLAKKGKQRGWKTRFIYLGTAREKNEGIESIHVHVTEDDPDSMIRAITDHKVDIVLHWPNWEETFSFTTFEAISAGAAVVTHTRSGNVAAAVRATGRGEILDGLEDLTAAFEDGRLETLAISTRRFRRSNRASVHRSSMTVDLLDRIGE